jgi:hypothetical protein
MSIQSINRCGVALFLVALLAGCSSGGPRSAARGDGPSIGSGVSARDDECKWNRTKCMYEGAYEPGERDYAEQEAKRLNQAASRRLRRISGR